MTESAEHPPTGQFTLRKMLALVAAWAVASAWPQWLSKSPTMPSGWGAVVFVALFYLLPVGVPLTLLIIRGRRAVPWLGAGMAIAVAIMIHGYVQVTRAHRSITMPESIWLAITLAGLGAGCGGNVGTAMAALRNRRWWTAAGWAFLAILCGGVFWLLRWLVLYAG